MSHYFYSGGGGHLNHYQFQGPSSTEGQGDRQLSSTSSSPSQIHRLSSILLPLDGKSSTPLDFPIIHCLSSYPERKIVKKNFSFQGSSPLLFLSRLVSPSLFASFLHHLIPLPPSYTLAPLPSLSSPFLQPPRRRRLNPISNLLFFRSLDCHCQRIQSYLGHRF